MIQQSKNIERGVGVTREEVFPQAQSTAARVTAGGNKVQFPQSTTDTAGEGQAMAAISPGLTAADLTAIMADAFRLAMAEAQGQAGPPAARGAGKGKTGLRKKNKPLVNCDFH